jgi:putative cell wall-binding protein
MVAAQPALAVAPAPTPVVQGNRLVDSRTNTTFVPHGVNIPGLEYSCVQGWRTLPASGEFAAIASWKINTVRLPLNESCWLGLDGAPSGSTVAQYKADVAAWVTGATAAGLAVILDLHWNAPAGYTASGQRAMPDARSSSFWSSIATAYAGNPSVMFELFNEPYSRSGFTLTWDCWKNGGCQAPVENDATGTLSGATYTVTGMQTLVSTVRSAGATQPILLGGLNYSNDLTGWLANKPADPANQLVAAWHNYPGQGCSTSCWNSTVTTVAASVPIVTTEFGNTSETTSTAANDSHNYLVPFMTWADAHGIGYMPWAWWDVGAAEANGNGSDVYALYTGSSFTPKSPSGTKFKEHLAALVPSGISVTRIGGGDRYATSAAITAANFPGTSSTVFIASGEDFPDALSTGPAAAKAHAPLLLVRPDQIPPSITAEIQRLHPSLIVVAGGSGAVSDAVYSQLAAMTTTIRRDYGPTRYETSQAITRSAFSLGDSTVAYVATGNGFADALSAASAAGSAGAPVILIDGSKSSVDSSTLALLSSLGVTTLRIVGGVASISNAIETQLRATPGITSVVRLGGANRYVVSGGVNRNAFTASETAFLASGLNYPDALSGAPIAGAQSSPLYIVPPECVPANVLVDLASFGVNHVVILGGTGGLSPAVEILSSCG